MQQPLIQTPRGSRTLPQVLRTLLPVVKAQFEPICQRVGIGWPPKRVTLLAFKQEKKLEVWGADRGSRSYRRLAVYPVLAASGTPGPKRCEGDRQVPEGFYRIDALNPNSAYHLSLRLDYPNADDRKHRLSPRTPLGDNIFVHGAAVSIGCIAIGDSAIEEVFTLVALARPGERRILVSPVDLRFLPIPAASEPWITELYQRLRGQLRQYQENGLPS